MIRNLKDKGKAVLEWLNTGQNKKILANTFHTLSLYAMLFGFLSPICNVGLFGLSFLFQGTAQLLSPEPAYLGQSMVLSGLILLTVNIIERAASIELTHRSVIIQFGYSLALCSTFARIMHISEETNKR